MKNNFRGTKSLIALAAGLCMAGVVTAQAVDGSIFGQAKASTAITILNVETGASRQITSDSTGNFTFSRVPPGRYRVTSNGETSEVNVVVGSGSQIIFGERLERVEVTGSRTRVIDVSSVEANSVFTSQQIERLPVARSTSAVALLAPSVVRGDSDLGAGNVPAMGGASVAENAYFINGFDVTNLRFMMSYANLPFDSIAQLQVKTGGYGAEYGRSLGGVLNMVTKRGTNEWKGGASVYWEPKSLRSKGRDVLTKDDDAISVGNIYYGFRSANRSDQRNYNLYAGGPVIKDKLFVFGLVEGRDEAEDTYADSTSTRKSSTRPNTMVKVDFAPTDMHHLELTAIDTKRKYKYTDYTSARLYSTSHDGAGRDSTSLEGGYAGIVKYTGYLTDNLTVSALAGKVQHKYEQWTGTRAGNSCPAVYGVGLVYEGCWDENSFGISQPDPTSPFTDMDTRKGYRLDIEYVLGKHTIRAGADFQKYTASSPAGTLFPGGVYWTYYRAPAAGATISTPGGTYTAAPNEEYVRKRIYQVTGGSYDVENNALYIEDSWKATKDLLLYGGVRSESFKNSNADGEAFVEKKNLLAPRLGFSLDLNGDSSFKIYGTAGRYYIPVSANMNVRMARGEYVTYDYYHYTGKDSVTAAPSGLSAPLVPQFLVSDGQVAPAATFAASNLKPMNQDELTLGFQKAIAKGLTFGVKGVYRKVNAGMDDTCNTGDGNEWAVTRWAADNGYTDYDPHTNSSCVLLNPGNDTDLALDLDGSGNLQNVTIPAKYWDLPKYKRTYKAVEFTLEKPFDGKWGGQINYVYSKSQGNSEGYVISGLNQEDPGATQDWDFPGYLHGADGYLPNDRRHSLKIYGTYAATDEIRVGGNMTFTSGRPYSCMGYIPREVATEQWTAIDSYYCRTDANTVALIPRGTAGRTPSTYQVDLQLAYTPKWADNKLTFQADVFNVLNSRKATEYNESRDYDLSSSGAPPYRLNQNYLQPTSFQQARYVRLTARYEF
jgi:hypothetical protein